MGPIISKSIVFLIATSRPDGNTWRLLRSINKYNAPIVDLTEKQIAYFDYQQKYHHDDFIEILEYLLQFQTIGFVSPLYWYSISAQMKTFIDRLSDMLIEQKDMGRRLRGKKSLLLATGSTEIVLPAAMEDVIRLTSEYLGMSYLGAYYGFIEKDLEIPAQVSKEGAGMAKGNCIWAAG